MYPIKSEWIQAVNFALKKWGVVSLFINLKNIFNISEPGFGKLYLDRNQVLINTPKFCSWPASAPHSSFRATVCCGKNNVCRTGRCGSQHTTMWVTSPTHPMYMLKSPATPFVESSNPWNKLSWVLRKAMLNWNNSTLTYSLSLALKLTRCLNFPEKV